MFGLRLGDDPRCVVTTTPKPVPLVLDLLKAATTVTTKGSTYDNRANLAPGFFADIITKYEGTRLGRQELNAELLDLGGLFFDGWSEEKHVRPARPVPLHWTFFGGLDWGKAAPFCFELLCADEAGKVRAIDEVYEAGLSNWEQAQAICRCLEARGIPKHSCLIYADPSMFPPADPAKRIGAYNIEDFQKAGLICIPAVNDRVNGWSRVKEFLAGDGTFEVFAGCCPNLVRTLALMVEDDKNKEDLRQNPKQEDHAVDPLRYALMSRPRPAKALPPPAPVQWGIVDGEIVEWEPARTLPRETAKHADEREATVIQATAGQAWTDLAASAYRAYAASTGNKNYRGEPMPAFEDLPRPIQIAWEAAARHLGNLFHGGDPLLSMEAWQATWPEMEERWKGWIPP